MKRGYPRAGEGARGPLVTNHINDLDMELELLNRKRQIIEQQQLMLLNSRYDQQPYHRSQSQFAQRQNYSQSRNFSHSHDDGPLRARNSHFGQNNQSVGLSWELRPSNPYVPQSNESRGFSTNRKTFPYKPRNPTYPPKSRNFNQHRETFNNAQTLKPKHVPQQTVKKGFNPTKVTKPKNKASSNAPNNLNKQPVNTRKALVAKAEPLCEEAPKEDGVLRIDGKARGKAGGRMELALGTLVKAFRQNNPQLTDFFNIQNVRRIKREMRGRLRKILMGKVVPQAQEIIKMYRAEFPPETDDAFVDICKDVEKPKETKEDPEAVSTKIHKKKKIWTRFLPHDDPERFFKIYLNKVLPQHVDKFCKRLTEIAQKGSNKTEDDLIADVPDFFVKAEVVSAADLKVEENSRANAVVESKVEVKAVESVKDELTNNESAKESSAQTEVVKVKENTSENEPADKQVNGAGDAVTENSNVSKEVVNSDSSFANRHPNRAETTKNYRMLIDKLFEKRLPKFMLKQQEVFLNVMDMNTIYRTSRGGVLVALNKLVESIKNPPPLISKDKSGEIGENIKKTPSSAKIAAAFRHNMFYVKVVGKPSLPDKRVMKVFIDGFNPRSIRKPKNVNNLLFIGFESEADMERILTSNGTTINGKKLVIAASNKRNRAQNNTNESDNTLNISTDLENSITQSLSDAPNSEDRNSSMKDESSCAQDGEESLKIESSSAQDAEESTKIESSSGQDAEVSSKITS